LKKVVGERTILDSKFFKGNSDAAPKIYLCLPNRDLSPEGSRQRFPEDIQVKVGIEKIVEEEVSNYPNGEDRDECPKKKSLFVTNHPLTNLLKNRIQGSGGVKGRSIKYGVRGFHDLWIQLFESPLAA
jgi:hypothetical protein